MKGLIQFFWVISLLKQGKGSSGVLPYNLPAETRWTVFFSSSELPPRWDRAKDFVQFFSPVISQLREDNNGQFFWVISKLRQSERSSSILPSHLPTERRWKGFSSSPGSHPSIISSSLYYYGQDEGSSSFQQSSTSRNEIKVMVFLSSSIQALVSRAAVPVTAPRAQNTLRLFRMVMVMNLHLPCRQTNGWWLGREIPHLGGRIIRMLNVATPNEKSNQLLSLTAHHSAVSLNLSIVSSYKQKIKK